MSSQYTVIAADNGADYVLERATGKAYLIVQTDKAAKKAWRKMRMRVLVRDNFQCQHPGCVVTDLDRLTIHHITPKAQGGKDELPNLICLCDFHHNETHRLADLAGGAQ